MQAKQFIDQLEAQGLLAPDIVQELRRQVDESKSRITPAALARLLVENGHLTKFQATKLVSELNQPAAQQPSQQTSSQSASARAQGSARSEEDELGLAPIEGLTESAAGGDQPQRSNKAVILDDDSAAVSDVEVVDDDVAEVVEIVDDEPVEVVEVVDDDVVEVVEVVDDDVVEVVPVEEAPVKRAKRSSRTEPSASSQRSGESGFRAPITKLPQSTAPAKPGTNPWESHRILTVSVVLAVLLVAAAFLVRHFTKGNADTMLAQAEEAYKPNSYEVAIKKYENFAESFPTHEQVSFARVRAGLAKIRKDIESLPNPTDALQTATTELPKLAKEPALADQRGDVAGALVSLAEKFNQRADEATDTAKKKELMTSMEKLSALLEDPQYVGNTARQQNTMKLARIEEDRQRILRDINRDEELQAALQKMDAALKENATAEAYQVRRELINRFPQLETDPGVIARVQEATRIQQKLVVAANPSVTVADEPPAVPQSRTVALANRMGSDAPALSGRVLCVRAKGTVYGLDGLTGNVKWRYYVGRDAVDDPVALSSEPESDVVVCRPELGQLTRLESPTGKVKWFCDLGTAAYGPRVDGEDMLVSTREGTLLDLDPESGQLKWAVQLPQPVEVTPNVSAEKPHIYLPGDHSNLYVLSRQDGKCKEVFYTGHRPGSIVVPPVLLLGQLFVFENRTNDRAFVRILQTDDTGLQLTPEQGQVEIEGNIVTPPLVDGRKLIVLSDRGQIKVFDIEPAAKKNKVSVIASVVASESKPTITWGVTEGNELWLANYRFARINVQVSSGKLKSVWSVDPGDQFVGPPQKFGDTIVHTRVVRGTRGVRVSAVTADKGDPIWMTDLGVPVALLASPGAGKYDAVTTGGAEFAIDVNQAQLNQAEASPEGSKPSVLYDNPRTLASGMIVMNNLSTPSRIAFYTPSASGDRLKIATANFGNGVPTAPPAVVGDNVAFGLDNGQLVLINPTNGSQVATPFQPPVEPGAKYKWNQPVYLESSKTLFAADGRRKLYRLAVGPALRMLSEIDVEGTVVGPLGVVGNQVAAVVSNQTEESLMLFDGTSLEKAGRGALDGRWQAGPFALSADTVLVQTERKLQAFGPGGEKRWEIDFPHVRLAQAPLVNETGIAIAATNGQAWLVDPQNGNVLSSLDVAQPLSAAPLAIKGGMLLGTDEGTVLLMPLSDSNTAAKESQ